jgi:TonB family protein
MRRVAKRNAAAFATLLLASIATNSRAATVEAGDAVRRLPFCVDVEVDVDGGVKIGEVRGVAEALQKLVITHLSTLQLQPARRSGEKLATRSQLRGEVVLKPASNDEYEVHIDSPRVGPCAISQALPRFPAAMAREGRSGTVLLEVRVGIDGHVVSAQALQSTRREFSDAALESARQWTFEPQWLGGEPVEVLINWPVVFRMETCVTLAKCTTTDASSPPSRMFACEWDESMPRVRDQPACADAIEVRGGRVRRGGGQIDIR